MYTSSTPLLGKGIGNPQEIADWAVDEGAVHPEDVRSYIETVYEVAPSMGLNPDVVISQSLAETTSDEDDRAPAGTPWGSDWWANRRNPAGIGITGDPRQDNASRFFAAGEEAAKAHLAHLGLYAGVDVPEELQRLDPRWDVAVQAGRQGVATTLDGLTNTWAADGQYASKIASKLNRLVTEGLLEVLEETPMAKNKLHVIIVAGHNSVGDGGNPTERKLTPNLARAYLAALKAAGISAEWINPTLTPGGLDGLASLTARKIRDADADLVLALDLHFNGANSGVHVIPAHNRKSNGAMLSTAIVAGRDPNDVMDNNTLDVAFAGSLARAIVAANPGMTLWGSTGIMPESQTGVGLDGYRLAMMAYSAPYRDKSIRVTVEHGGTNDASRPNFYNRCADAAVATVKTVLGTRIDVPEPQPEEPEPPEGDPGDPTLASFFFGAANGYQFDEDGPVSKLWLERSNKESCWPRLVDVHENKDIKFFVFSNGWVIIAGNNGVGFLTDELEG